MTGDPEIPRRIVHETPLEVRWIKVQGGLKLQQRWRVDVFKNGVLGQVLTEWREVEIYAGEPDS